MALNSPARLSSLWKPGREEMYPNLVSDPPLCLDMYVHTYRLCVRECEYVYVCVLSILTPLLSPSSFLHPTLSYGYIPFPHPVLSHPKPSKSEPGKHTPFPSPPPNTNVVPPPPPTWRADSNIPPKPRPSSQALSGPRIGRAKSQEDSGGAKNGGRAHCNVRENKAPFFSGVYVPPFNICLTRTLQKSSG